MKKYNHQKIEKKWVKAWDKSGIYNAADPSTSSGQAKPKYYVLVEFPYPSGVGLHVGHIRSNTAMDIVARKRRMQGHNVLYPMGWDAFGLPTENYAIKTGIAPQVATKKNTTTFKKQLKTLGFSFDWSREIDTTDPKYYKWTQWMFLQFFKHGLAYKDKAEINWCPKDKIGLANEEVETRSTSSGQAGFCERCGGPVEKRQKEQWMLKMSAYSEKLLSGLEGLDFIPEVTTSQQNWIGKSEGAEIRFPIVDTRIKRFVLLHGKGGNSKANFIPWLKTELEKRGYEVQTPDMPSTNEPNDEEQADFVEKNCTLDEKTVIIGHSFGGLVALRLLERGAKVAQLVLVAAPFSRKFLDGKERPTVTAAIKKGFNGDLIKKNAQRITLLYDTHDSIVPISDGEGLAANLGGRLIKIRAENQHFTGQQEPSILSGLVPSIKVFTTRPDTIFGATFLVIAPEHPSLQMALSDTRSFLKNKDEVKAYIDSARKKTEMQRSAEGGEKSGIELKGLQVINPATKEEIPVWTADYVLSGYGTGAIMAVPAHDERDYEFAKKFQLQIRKVIRPVLQRNARSASDMAIGAGPVVAIESECWPGPGELVNSGKFSGEDSEKAIDEIIKFIGAQKKTTYKLRDWVFSRQRYWGEPIPLIHCGDCGWIPVPEDKLPVKLPKVEKYQPTDNGESPLSKVDTWVNVKCPTCKKPAKRETDTMPNWAGSSWYFLRYLDPKNDQRFADKEKMKHWLPVDWYNGGMEHATRHLLYARFWNQFFHDIGEVPVSEPFHKRTSHGIILGADGTKMSKSVGNVVNPDELVKEFGADALRMYEMFIGPFDQMVAWDPRGILGTSRFLEKVWRTALPLRDNSRQSSAELNRLLHKTIKKVSEDIEKMSFNTAVSAMMVFINEVSVIPAQAGIQLSKNDWETFLKLLAPFAPFITEELWAMLGNKESIHLAPWPEFDAKLLVEENFDLVIQINGRVRAKVSAARGISEAEAKKIALENADIKKWVTGDIKKVIFIENRLINLIV